MTNARRRRDGTGAATRMTQDLVDMPAGTGALRETGADGAFRLDREAVWLVRTGRLDVYAVPMRDGAPTGRRRHLLRVEAGGAVFGAGGAVPGGAPNDARDATAPEIRLLAAGNPGTTVEELSRAAVEGCEPALAALLDGWVTALTRVVAPAAPPDSCEEIAESTTGALRRGTAVRPARGVGWLRGEARALLVAGAAELVVPPGVELPLGADGWAALAGPGRVALRATHEVLAAGAAWTGLAVLHGIVLRTAAGVEARAHDAERERLSRKQAAVRSTMLSAFSRITAMLGADDAAGTTPMRLRATEDAGAQDALFAAYRLVGEAGEIPVKLTAGAVPGSTLAAQAAALARLGRLRVRQVALRDDWWRGDGGPLLGETEEGRHPVALIPVPGGGYVVCNPADRSQQRATAEVARTLSPFAYAFTRPFSGGTLALPQVLRFGLRGCGHDVRMVVALGVVTGVLGMLTPLLTGVIFNSVIPGAARGQLLELMGILVAAAVATSLFTIARGVALLRVEGRMGAAIQAAVWDRLLSLPLPFYRDYSAGDLAARAMGIEEIRQALSGATVTAIFGGLFSLFNFGLLFYYDARLAWWATGIIVVALALTVLVSWLQRRDQREIARLRNRTAGLVLQFLTNIGKLRVAAAEVHAFALWVRQFSQQRRLQFRVRAIGNWFAVFNAVLPAVATMLLFGIVSAGDRGATTLHAGAAAAPALSTGDFVGFLAAFGACLAAVLSTGTAVVGAVSVVPAYENAQPILAAAPEVDEAKTDPGPLAGDIELRHVAFRYRAETPLVLRDLSLHVRRGEYVALVGPSGSGKSTILRLLLGFDVPESGAVQYDGQDLAGLDVQAVRRQIGVVLQSGRLTPGDIFSNVVGSTGATMADALEAVRMAGLAEDVKQMPMGLHTIVSEGGETLSGGQRQRLLIARAIVSRPRLIFFDEATSALDNHTQAIVSASLTQLRATRIVIAHRLSTIMHADRICVVEQGAIVQSGTYDELIRQEGLFATLARRQIA